MSGGFDAVQAALGSDFYQRAMIECAVLGLLSGVIGVHILLRRLPFFVVALSHATFPGLVLASIAGLPLMLGGLGAGVVFAAMVVALGAVKSADRSDTVGAVLAGSFALGVVLLFLGSGNQFQLAGFLVGSVLTISTGDVWTSVAACTVVCLVCLLLHKELVLAAFDADASQAAGYPKKVLDALVLSMVAVAVVAVMPAVGVLLTVALLTVPSMTARLWTERLGRLIPLSVAFACASGVLGLLASAMYAVAAGGAIALCATAMFLLSLAATSGARWLTRQAAPGRASGQPAS